MEGLTRRETEVMELVAQGSSNKEIADRIHRRKHRPATSFHPCWKNWVSATGPSWPFFIGDGRFDGKMDVDDGGGRTMAIITICPGLVALGEETARELSRMTGFRI